MKRVALTGVVAVAVTLMSGCTLIADDGQKKTVAATFAALPEPVTQALRAGKVRLHFFGDPGVDVGADRQIRLDAGPVPDTTLGRWVTGCQAMVKALAPTPARLYGRLPDGPEIYAGTDALCLRGLGHPLVSTDKPALLLGLPENGRVVDTAVNFNPDAGTIETFGFDWRPRGGDITVAEAVPAALDAAVQPARVPWRPADPDEAAATFLAPAGQALRLTAACGAGWERAGHLQFEPREDGNYLTFGGGSPSQYPSAKGMQACGTTLRRDLKPQLSYRTADGLAVDRYAFITLVSAVDQDEADPAISVSRP